jgi:hypothetical protein
MFGLIPSGRTQFAVLLGNGNSWARASSARVERTEHAGLRRRATFLWPASLSIDVSVAKSAEQSGFAPVPSRCRMAATGSTRTYCERGTCTTLTAVSEVQRPFDWSHRRADAGRKQTQDSPARRPTPWMEAIAGSSRHRAGDHWQLTLNGPVASAGPGDSRRPA